MNCGNASAKLPTTPRRLPSRLGPHGQYYVCGSQAASAASHRMPCKVSPSAPLPQNTWQCPPPSCLQQTPRLVPNFQTWSSCAPSATYPLDATTPSLSFHMRSERQAGRGFAFVVFPQGVARRLSSLAGVAVRHVVGPRGNTATLAEGCQFAACRRRLPSGLILFNVGTSPPYTVHRNTSAVGHSSAGHLSKGAVCASRCMQTRTMAGEWHSGKPVGLVRCVPA